MYLYRKQFFNFSTYKIIYIIMLSVFIISFHLPILSLIASFCFFKLIKCCLVLPASRSPVLSLSTCSTFPCDLCACYLKVFLPFYLLSLFPYYTSSNKLLNCVLEHLQFSYQPHLLCLDTHPEFIKFCYYRFCFISIEVGILLEQHL